MSINRTEPTSSITNNVSQHDLKLQTRNRDVNATNVAGKKSDGTTVQLSSLTQKIQQDESQDVDTARLQKIKADMDAGTLDFDYDQIARAMVQNIFQFSD